MCGPGFIVGFREKWGSSPVFIPKTDLFIYFFSVENLFPPQASETGKVVEDNRCPQPHQLNRGMKTQPSVGLELSLKAEHQERLVGVFLDPCPSEKACK